MDSLEVQESWRRQQKMATSQLVQGDWVEPTTGFDAVVEEVVALHRKKSVGYGTNEDPTNNIKAVKEIGLEPKLGVVIRMLDKWFRIKRWYNGAKIEDEKMRDNMLDLAVYAMIWLQLDNEEKGYV